MSHLGKLFKHKGHKAPTPPRKDYDGTKSGSDESDNDEGYLDPVAVHPTTDPATAVQSVQMPSYPPPRPNHSPSSRRVQDPGKRASVPIGLVAQLSRPPVPKARSQRPQSAEHLQGGKTPIPAQRLGLKIQGDDYSDPWDAKKAVSPGGDYSDPWDAKKTQAPPGDDYCDPWDKKPTAPDSVRKTSKDDYCDPWDAKKDGSSPPEIVQVTKDKSKKPSSDDSDEEGYDEPYDLGKVTVLDEPMKRFSLKGMRPSPQDDSRKQSPSRDQRPADDYDSPWESKSLMPMMQKSQGVAQNKSQSPVSERRSSDDYEKPWEYDQKSLLNGQNKSPMHPGLLQSPKADARPADDYDAPWEFSKTGQAVQGTDVRGMGAAAAPRKPPRTFANQPGAVDPNLPLEQQGWYHGPLKRLEAEKLLKEAEDCSFLLRNSESSKNDFSLSVRIKNSFMHLKIVCQNNKYILGQFSKPFDTVPEMIHYYSINKLNIKGAEHKQLLHPVIQQPEYFTLEPPVYSTAM